MAYKRFLAFSYQQFYPSGGMGDCDDSFDTLEEAIALLEKDYADFREIFDCDTRNIVWSK